MAKILIKNGTIYYQKRLQKLDLLIDNNLILEIGNEIQKTTDATIIDATNLTILPGLIDIHVHLREPGYEEKETIKTGTKAAAAGGFTTICCMPNLNPVTDCEENIKYLLSLIAKDAIVNVLPYASITENEEGKNLVNFKSLSRYCFAFSDDGVGIQNKRIMEGAMITARPLNKVIVAHCEDKTLNGNESEYIQVARDIELAKKTSCHYHVCHISTQESVNLIRSAKLENIKVSCEVTPHHLLLCKDDITDEAGGAFKMNPPLREKKDQESLISGLVDGTIDIIVTDHAPHTKQEKSQGYANSLNGIVGLETSFSLIYTNFVKNELISFDRFVELMSTNACKLFNIDGGIIEINKIANLTIANLSQQ
jgi:dihydroorotase